MRISMDMKVSNRSIYITSGKHFMRMIPHEPQFYIGCGQGIPIDSLETPQTINVLSKNIQNIKISPMKFFRKHLCIPWAMKHCVSVLLHRSSISFQSSGLYYKELTTSGSTADQALLASLPGTVMSGYVPAGFVPKYALIFTWYKMSEDTNEAQRVSMCTKLLLQSHLYN